MKTASHLMQQQASAYLQALQQSDLSAILSLFSPTAKVYSPLYGIRSASDFYSSLLADSQQSDLTHLDTFCKVESRRAALYFHYSWTMRNGEKCNFHCVDILEFTSDFLIDSLRIIYDTANTREAFRQL